MTKHNTKRALVLSIVSLLLCVSMMAGTTFAWFTDSASSAGNVIQAGTLDVMLVDAEGADLEGEIIEFVSADANKASVDILWEPGCTYNTEEFYVKNNGNLALKYQITINGIVGNAKLLEAIEWTVTVGGVATALDALTGTLLPDTTSAAIVLTGHMKEDAGNEYQKLSIEGISITVVATQFNYESDSFGPDYDADLDLMKDGVSRVLEDGSTAFYYDETSEFYGRVRLAALPENLGSEYIVPAEINDLGDELVGATLDKLTIHAGVEYAYKSLERATIGEVVLEEGMTTIPNRLFYKTNVENVVIPSGVTTIEECAFAQSTIKAITIPASVETIAREAFIGAASLATVTIEGNVEIQDRAFRGCKALRTVYLKGEDVKFVPVKYSDMWIGNGENLNSGSNNITFYVENETVAARVKTAMGADAANIPVYIGELLFVPAKNVTELQNALNNATEDTIISITSDIVGDVVITQKNNIDIVINGNNTVYSGTIDIAARSDNTAANILTIKNFNFKTTETDHDFITSVETNHYPVNVTIADCTFEGTGADSNVVPITMKSSNHLVIERCTATKVHSFLQNTSGWNLTVRDCTVTEAGRGISLGSVQNCLIQRVNIEASDVKYGIRMKAAYNVTTTIEDCEISAFAPVVVREASANYTLVFNGTNVMTEANTDGIWCAIGTSEYETNGEMPTAATGTVTVTLNDAGLDANGVYGNQ